MPDTTSLTGHPHSLAPWPSGRRLACASASAGSGMPCRGGSCCQGQWSHIHPWGQSSKDKLQYHTPLGAGGELIQPSIRPRAGWMWPQSWGLRRFNARPCQMVQDQRFNLPPPSQLPHPNLSPAATGSWVLSYCSTTRWRGGRQCHHGKPSLSLLSLWAEATQHLTAATQPSPAPPPPAAQHVSLPTRFGEVCGQQRASGAEQWWDPWLSLALPQHSPVRSVVLWGALRGCRGVLGGLQGSLTVCSTTRCGSESSAWLLLHHTPCSGACQGPEPPSCPGCRSVPTCAGREG